MWSTLLAATSLSNKSSNDSLHRPIRTNRGFMLRISIQKVDARRVSIVNYCFEATYCLLGTDKLQMSSNQIKLIITFCLIESSVHNNIMHDVNRHRGTRFQNKPFFKVERVHESFISEFGKRRMIDQDRKQNLINNRFPSLAEARDQYLK